MFQEFQPVSARLVQCHAAGHVESSPDKVAWLDTGRDPRSGSAFPPRGSLPWRCEGWMVGKNRATGPGGKGKPGSRTLKTVALVARRQKIV